MDASSKNPNLRVVSEDSSAAEFSIWQPRCIARAFATPATGIPVFTVQTWIDLDAARSPLLEGNPPETEDGIHDAVDAFRCGPVDLSAEEAAGLMQNMIVAIEEAFAMGMTMTPPGGKSDPRALGLAGGFGDWLPIYTALIAQLGLSCAEANALPVAKAIALLATHKRNLGWMPAGATYADRDVIQSSKEDARE